jgi:hypothetical protein
MIERGRHELQQISFPYLPPVFYVTPNGQIGPVRAKSEAMGSRYAGPAEELGLLG